MATINGKTLTERIRAPFIKGAGLLKRARFAVDGWDNDFMQRAATVLGSSTVDLIGTDARNNLLLGGALQVAQLQPIQYAFQTSSKCVTSPIFVNANDATPLEIVAIQCIFSVANGAAMTAYVSKESATSQAPGAGATAMNGTFNLNATANTLQTATLAGIRGTAAMVVNAGEQLSLKISAAVTSIAGLTVTVWVRPFQGVPPATYSIVANGDIATSTMYINNIPGLTIRGVSMRWGTLATNGGAVTADITKEATTAAPGAGTTILAAALSVKTTINTTMYPALTATAANLVMAQNERLSLKMTGTLTALANLIVTVFFTESTQNLLVISPNLLDTNLVSRNIFISNGFYELLDFWATWGVASSSGTLTITRDTGTTAPGAGTALLTGTISTAATANTPLEGTKVAVVPTLMLKPGDRLGILHGGTTTNLANLQVAATLRKL